MTNPATTLNFTSFGEMYENHLVGPLFRPFAEALLAEVGPSAGDSVLDVACGTGVVARLAAEKLGSGAQIVGVDLSPGMIAVARSVAPDIDWREGDATALPLRDGEQFDVVVCQQGLQFVPDKLAAVRQMRRALAPGGRLAMSTWRPLEEIPLVRELHRIAEHRLGPIVDQRHAFGEPKPIETLLEAGGLREIRLKVVSRTVRFAERALFIRMNTMALVGMSPASKEMSDDERARVVAEIASACEEVSASFADGDGIAFEISTNLATARA